jgi:hypothetical protein
VSNFCDLAAAAAAVVIIILAGGAGPAWSADPFERGLISYLLVRNPIVLLARLVLSLR